MNFAFDMPIGLGEADLTNQKTEQKLSGIIVLEKCEVYSTKNPI